MRLSVLFQTIHAYKPSNPNICQAKSHRGRDCQAGLRTKTPLKGLANHDTRILANALSPNLRRTSRNPSKRVYILYLCSDGIDMWRVAGNFSSSCLQDFLSPPYPDPRAGIEPTTSIPVTGSKDLPQSTTSFGSVSFSYQFRAKPIYPSIGTTLAGKTAIMTGSNPGLGHETAVQLLDISLSRLIWRVIY